MTHYGLIKVNTTDTSYDIMPTAVGSVIVYDPSKNYSPYDTVRGMQVLIDGTGEYGIVAFGDTFMVVSVEDEDMFPDWIYPRTYVTKMTVVYTTTVCDAQLESYFDFSTMEPNYLLSWGQLIGDKPMISTYMVDDRFFVEWVKYIYPEDHDRCLSLITTNSVWANWGIEIGDRDICRPHIVDDRDILSWALAIPEDRPIMKTRITTQPYADAWNQYFPNDPITVLASPTPTPTLSLTPSISLSTSVVPSLTPEPTVDVTPTPSSTE